MAGAKRPPARRKKRSRAPISSLPPTRSPRAVRFVTRSSSATTVEAARRLGVSVSTLRRRAQAGSIRAVIDARGNYHFPGVSAGAPLHGKKRTRASKRPSSSISSSLRKKRKVIPASPISRKPAKIPDARATKKKRVVAKKAPRTAKKSKLAKKRRVAPVRKKSPRIGKKKPAKRKLVSRRKKKKRLGVVSRPKPPTIPGPFGVPIVDPSFSEAVTPSAAAPMPMDMAAKMLGDSMRDYVMARFKEERSASHQSYYDLRYAFRQTYGDDHWNDTFDWIVDEWGLDSYIFDRNALRDSDVRES